MTDSENIVPVVTPEPKPSLEELVKVLAHDVEFLLKRVGVLAQHETHPVVKALEPDESEV